MNILFLDKDETRVQKFRKRIRLAVPAYTVYFTTKVEDFARWLEEDRYYNLILLDQNLAAAEVLREHYTKLSNTVVIVHSENKIDTCDMMRLLAPLENTNSYVWWIPNAWKKAELQGGKLVFCVS